MIGGARRSLGSEVSSKRPTPTWSRNGSGEGFRWEHAGIICTGETYTSVVKLTFAKGASLPDPAGLFNSSLDGNVRRAIDIREGEDIDEAAFKALVREAIVLNASGRARSAKKTNPAKKANA